MKKVKHIILSLLTICTFLLTTSSNTYAAKKAEESRAIGIVFDNSGSMYVDGQLAWCRATYAMEVFASMLNKGDTLQIYPMHPITVDKKEYTMNKPLTITDSSQASSIRNIFTKEALGTPIESVDKAITGINKVKADKKYVIVLTDGDKFYKNNYEMSVENTKSELKQRFEKNASASLSMMYLGIGENVVTPGATKSKYIIEKAVSDSDETLAVLTEMCNTIFGRDSVPKKFIQNNKLTLDISINKLIVFVQGENVSDLKLSSSSGNVGKKESSATTKYGTDGCGNYESVSDKSLQGMMVTYTNVAAGTYNIEYKGKASSVEVYYEPNADLAFVFTDADGNTVDPKSLYEGDYKVSFGMQDGITKQMIESELLGKPHYEVTYTINGKSYPFSQDGFNGEVPIKLKMNDKFEANLTVTYLNDYTLHKDSSEFGWQKGGITVAAKPAGNLKLKISGGDKQYSLQDLEKGSPYIAEVYYQDKKLTGKELEKVKLTWQPETSHAEIKQTFADDHYNLTLHYKNPKAPANTQCGKCKVTIYAEYAAQGSEASKANTTMTYKIEDDFIPVDMALDISQDYIVIKNIEESEPIIVNFTMDGKPLSEEDFKSLSLQVDTGGIEYQLTPNSQNSSYAIQLKSTNGIDKGKYAIKVTGKYLDHIKRETTMEASGKIKLDTIEKWIKWLIIILIILFILLLIWLISRIKVLPKRIHIAKSASRFIFDGENAIGATSFVGELNGKQMRIYNKYDGSKMGISMEVKPGKESFLSKGQTKRYAEVINGVKKFGGETITEVSVGTTRFVLNEDTGKLERTPQGKSAINLRHGMPIRYAGRMDSGGTTKTFNVSTKLNFKRK